MTTATTSTQPDASDEGFRHEALLYCGADEFVAATSAFIREGLADHEPILVVVGAAKIALLRDELGRDAQHVQFADMADVGQNPARIIPAWRQFVDAQSSDDRRLRGIGEPIWNGRTPAELVECQRHESLLNVAFDPSTRWSLLCPYDVDALDEAVVDEARASHPYVRVEGLTHASSRYRGDDAEASRFEAPLPEPPVQPFELPFSRATLKSARHAVAQFAADAGCSPKCTADFVLAVNELATNSLLHGGGDGVLRLWQDGAVLVGEVRDGGRFNEPLAGRERPPPDQEHGRGLWVANQVCELVQVRSFETGTVVRVHLHRS